MTRAINSVIGALALIFGFGIAQVTGVRLLGGIALIAGAIWCAAMWWSMAGPVRAVIAVVVFGLAFVISHPLGAVIGAWPAVLIVALVAALLTYAITPPRSTRR